MKLKVGAICPGLNTDGCYSDIMPNVTGEQLAVLLEVGEQGEDAEMWNVLASHFLRYGQRELVVANADRLIGLINLSYSAGLALICAPDLSEVQRDALVAVVTKNLYARWVLRDAPDLTDAQRKTLSAIK